jgi:hypothetical protein
VKRAKRKRRSEPKEFTPEVKAKVDEAIRIRTRMLIRDHQGNERIFRSTVLEEGTENEETEGDSG